MSRNVRNIAIYVLVLLLIYLAVSGLYKPEERIPELDNTELIEKIEDGVINDVKIVGTTLYVKDNSGNTFMSKISNFTVDSFVKDYLKSDVESGKIVLSYEDPPSAPWYSDLLSTLLMIVVMAAIWIFLMNRMQGGNSKTMNFGKSRAKLNKNDDKNRVTFKDVAGLKEEKEELYELVDFLKMPKKYISLGARIPTGVLLVGPPGTGKTYLSRAVAGEAGVPFYLISGSDFVEMFVGVGASRVRDLFDEAKKNAPAIVFIDEIDAVGRRRGAGVGGGHDEREQTLNQLLVEMDGFSKNEGIIVMAATNRADILDPALLRPGRFDRTVYVGMPDVKEREAILEVHTKNKPMEPDVDLKVVAKQTPGYTPADLENLVNEAAILTARANKTKITNEIINEAAIKVEAGPAKKSRVISLEERKLTAIHEAGHAITARVTPGTDPVHMITIIPRGMAGGFTSYLPDEKSFITKTELKNRLIVLLGGRAAEEVVLKEISTGASNDIERATAIARSMVVTYGMSEELGTIKYGEEDHEVFMGLDYNRGRGYSEEVASKIDEVIHNMIDSAYKNSKDIIEKNREALDRITNELLEKETLSGEEFEELFKGEVLSEDLKEISDEKEKNEPTSDEIS